MKKEILNLNYKKNKIEVVTNIVPWYYEGIGLMFSRREQARILLFKFKQEINLAIHSWFVFYPFIAIWLDSVNKIVDVQIVKPFRCNVLPKGKKFDKLIEIPISTRNKKLFEKFL